MNPDQEVYDLEVGAVPCGAETFIERDARDLPWPGPQTYTFRACCLKGWHDLEVTVTEGQRVFGRQVTVAEWQRDTLTDRFSFGGSCPDHGATRLAPRGVICGHVKRMRG